MDPVPLIVTALAAGAELGLKDAARPQDADAYTRLKALVQRKLAGCGDAEQLMIRYEQEPQVWDRPLARELNQAGAGDDGVLVAAAEAVMRLVDAAGVAAGKYSVEISNAGNVQVGDNNLQVIFQRYANQEPVIQNPASAAGKIVIGPPQRAAPAFQPREDLLAGLAASGPDVPVVRAMTGMHGVGKTQLAAAYARRCIDAGWRLVAWVSAQDNAQVLSGLAEVAAAMGITAPDAESQAQAVRRRLEVDGDQCLVVFDNVTDLDRLKEVLPTAGRCQVVITSNEVEAAWLGLQIAVDVFNDAEALSFLEQRTGRHDNAGATELAEQVGYLPLALAQAAAVIAKQGLDYPTFLARLDKTPVADYLKRVIVDPYPVGVAGAIVLALDTAADADETGLSCGLMRLIALLSVEGVPRTLLHAAGQLGILGQASSQTAAGPEAVDQALGQLAGASLLTFDGSGSVVSGHLLTMRVLLERAAGARDGSVAVLGAGAVRLLNEATRSLSSPGTNRAATRDAAKQILGMHEHLIGFVGPHDTALIMDLLLLRGWAIERMSQFGDSFSVVVEKAPRLVDDCEQMLGPDHPETLRARNSLAYGYVEAGDLNRAIPLYERTAADRERVLGTDHRDTLSSQNNLVYAYHMDGRWAEVIPLYEQCVADCVRVLGPGDRETLTAQTNLAAAYEDVGRLAEAIALNEQILAGRTSVLGPDHQDTLGSRNNLAHGYRKARRLDDAISMSEQLPSDCERVLGPGHWQTHGARNALATAYQAAGRLDEAIPMFEQSLNGFEQALGPDHPHSQHIRNNLAGAYRAAGRLPEAILLYQRALVIREQVLGDTHPDTLTTFSDLGLAYLAAGQPTEAIPLLERALAGRKQVLGDDHADTRKSLSDLTLAYEIARRTSPSGRNA